MHDHSISLREGLLHVAKKVSSVDAVICNFAWLIVPAFKSFIMWTDPFNAMANSNGLANVNKDFHLSMPAQSTFCVEHMVWWTSAQYPYRPCVTGPLHPAKLTDPVAMLYIVSYFYLCCAYSYALFTFVSFCCLRLCYVHLCTWFLMTVMCMQLHLVHVQSLRLAPKCHAFV